ncbi:ABC transporter permease [Nocardia aurantia]|uniref:Transport permease protein n=1 Tax=Nocardia aurantia TaxID=2585199 RepID=A0A7K0DN73_9NOCA|nr:ABC transporter permease [Nocardia aurantia]MQY27195.1 Daunorubicin/doxorubicin resistance ABC transporter permease protein DrrB [Nocardia aurantia]
MRTTTAPATDTVTMLRRNLVHAKRYPGMTIGVIVMPVLLLLLFDGIFGGALGKATGGVEYIDYVVPGMMLMIPAYLVAGVAVGVASDMTKGIVNRFRTMPMSHPAILTGQVLGTLIQGLLGVVLMVAVGVLIGFRSGANPLEWLAAFGLVGLVIFGLAWLGVGFGLAASTPESASNLPAPILFLPFLGSGLVPTGTMPTGLRQFAEYQPFTPMTETLRGLLSGTSIGHNGIVAVAWCLGFAAVGYWWSRTQFRRKSR